MVKRSSVQIPAPYTGWKITVTLFGKKNGENKACQMGQPAKYLKKKEVL